MSETKIIQCSCEHKYQDKEYGKPNRVHNWCKNHPSKEGGWRCTVCGDEKRG
jgi:hypothetical protein